MDEATRISLKDQFNSLLVQAIEGRHGGYMAKMAHSQHFRPENQRAGTSRRYLLGREQDGLSAD